MMYPRSYRIETRDTSRHGRYAVKYSNLTALQAKISWEGLNIRAPFNARLWEFDGYRDVVVARKQGTETGYVQSFPRGAR